ncbi:sensor histidine kinase [Acanthopleuribacter pedis]|uniref:histidine kinase n=1 Tax=Acanthopleuribacter pedis TaxID=442870 RepID=A0A8J7QDP4_9BACT|nr:ATP-binding protein [Acanthopleuribacter pedis]MBO1317183.1 PAS domain-containing protein [Acanthopleuribacter pedis]
MGQQAELFFLFLILTPFGLLVLIMMARLVFWAMQNRAEPVRIRPPEELLVETLRERTLGERQARLDQKASQLALDQLELLHHDILDAIPVAVSVLGEDGSVYYANPLFRHMLGIDAIVGQHLASVSDRLNGQWLEMLALGQSVKFPVSFESGNKTLYLQLTLTNLQNNQFLFTIQDRTRAQILDQRLRLKNELELMGEMAGGITHEVKNALAVIQGRVQMLKYGAVEENSAKIQDEINHLTDFVNAFRRSSSGESHSMEQFTLAGWFERLRQYWEGHPDGVWVGLPDGNTLEGGLLGDDTLLSTVVNNLILNGLEAVRGAEELPDEAPWVWVEVIEDDEVVQVMVRDRGPGIVPEMRKKLFVPFVTSKERGTGLGLFHSRKIMLEHQGRLELREGMPTTFACVFPKELF